MNPLKFLLDLLYPARCVSCSAAGDWWCKKCRDDVELVPKDPCPRCLTFAPWHDVMRCSGSLPFTGIVSTGYYHSPPLRRLIAGLKYDGVTAVAPSLDVYLRDTVASRAFSWTSEPSLLIQPMPLSDKRERERGFNQAAFIAERIKSSWNIQGDISDLLLRRNSDMAQAELAHDSSLRSANVQGQFAVTKRIDHPVLLIDDVVTTGSTAAEAARALLSAGAPRIYLATLAVGK